MRALDASAILAWAFRETGGELVAAMLPGAMVSAVNLAEVQARVRRDGHDARPVATLLAAHGVRILPFDDHDALLTADLLPMTQSAGLSLGDRACLALAIRRGAAAVTADRSWLQVDAGVHVECIR